MHNHDLYHRHYHHVNFHLRIVPAAVVIVKAAGQLLENSWTAFGQLLNNSDDASIGQLLALFLLSFLVVCHATKSVSVHSSFGVSIGLVYAFFFNLRAVFASPLLANCTIMMQSYI